MSWKKTIGRVAFLNCEPLFHSIPSQWNVLAAPPSWLTGHILRRDCIVAPIPAADYAKHRDELILIPDIGICSKGEVGSVLLFSNKSLLDIKTVALPTDSATSVVLCKHILKSKGIEVEYQEMGPDIDAMMAVCDAALLIGDRALQATKEEKYRVVFDLGQEWFRNTALPMVFGVFAARKDTPIDDIQQAHRLLLANLEDFENNKSIRANVVQCSALKSHLTVERLERYFGEVFNRLDEEHILGLNSFLSTIFGSSYRAEFLELDQKLHLVEQAM